MSLLPPTRRQRIQALEDMLCSAAWQEVSAEIDRLYSEAIRNTTDLDLSNAKRDGAAGAKDVLEKLKDYPRALIRTLEAAARKEKKPSLPK